MEPCEHLKKSILDYLWDGEDLDEMADELSEAEREGDQDKVDRIKRRVRSILQRIVSRYGGKVAGWAVAGAFEFGFAFGSIVGQVFANAWREITHNHSKVAFANLCPRLATVTLGFVSTRPALGGMLKRSLSMFVFHWAE